MPKSISVQEVQKHASDDDLWLVVDGNVYDLTEFAPEHPGGIDIILRYAGRDATVPYSEIHSPSLIKSQLPPEKHIGTLDTTTIPSSPDWLKPPPTVVTSRKPGTKPPLETLLNTYDFEEVASRTLTPKAWAFYWSAATDLHTKRRNNSAYADIGLRPRILKNVRDCSSATTMLGQKLSVPIFCAPAALAKLAHPDGEAEMARGCKAAGVPECVSTAASLPIEDIFAAAKGGVYGDGNMGEMPLFFQLYVDKQREKSVALLRKVEALGAKGILVTVDAPVAGKREADERVKADEGLVAPNSGVRAVNDKKGGALGRIMASFIDPSLTWDDIPWLRKHTKLPIVLKGIQTAMDAKRAMEAGIDGILISNHGGRSLDTSPAPVLVLLEMQKCCSEVFDKMEVYVDGGIMRGTDIFKALCLGAKAVGIGRGLLYALNYGQEGVTKYVEILKDELETTMRMCGVTDVTQVHPGLLNTLAVDHLIPSSDEHPYAKWRPKSRL